jgi:bifunctional non-homologous end joining protein LigD
LDFPRRRSFHWELGPNPAICAATERRKADLARLLAAAGPGLRLNDWIADVDGATIFEHACKLGLEGIVSKRSGSRYESGRSSHWLKIKNPNHPAVLRLLEEDWNG